MKTKKNFRRTAFTLAVLLAFSLTLMPLFSSTQVSAADTVVSKKTITVTGNGIVNVTPDMATITLGVSSFAADANAAQKANATTMAKVIAAIKAAGVAASDIQTSSYSIYPNYTYEEKTGKQTITGYNASNTVTVTIRNLSNLGTVLDKASDAGANQAYGISFMVSKQSAYYAQALKEAVANAKTKADAIASALGTTVSSPVSISESSNYNPIYLNSSAKQIADAAGGTPVEAGTFQIQATVSVVYEY
jgi:uncharacterized protein YggE